MQRILRRYHRKACHDHTPRLSFIVVVLAVVGSGASTSAVSGKEPAWRSRMTAQVHGYRCKDLAFSRDGRLLASVGPAADGSGEIKLWNVATGQEAASWAAHAHEVRAVEFSPDGRTMATGSGPWEGDGEIKLWNVDTRTERSTLAIPDSGVLSLSFAPNGRRIAVGNGYYSDERCFGAVALWDLAAEKETPSPTELLRGEGNSLAFSPDGSRLATSSGAFDAGLNRIVWELTLWDAVAGKPQDTLYSSRDQPGGELWSVISSVAFSHDGKFLAAGGRSGTKGFVRVWDMATRGIWATLPEQPGAVWAVTFSPDSKTLATAGNSQPIKFWDTATSQEIASLDVFDGGVFALAMSPDGKHVVAGGSRLNGDDLGDNQTGFIAWWIRDQEK